MTNNQQQQPTPAPSWTDQNERDSWQSPEDEYTSYLTWQSIERFFQGLPSWEREKRTIKGIMYLSNFGEDRPIWEVTIQGIPTSPLLSPYMISLLVYRYSWMREEAYRFFDEYEVRQEPDPAKVAVAAKMTALEDEQ